LEVNRALQELSQAGKVVKVRKGYYMIADSNEPPLPPTLYPAVMAETKSHFFYGGNKKAKDEIPGLC
jgi:hypothetical protein